ncbi:TIGR04282 family arsenosugar biosynthesis glycosyltransferase [Pseudofulvibacter geojedonensis]|uniref:TIGR04282 family arsenosugar biosynthesis glycosyltransferase n=1 Tax=Pseudofulvibacter geojedonensis TaxID=1123758 RepID=A0ABW3I1J4_9FLAO
MNDTLLLIFTRNPELGKCKTRLAKTIGNENALTVYKMLLEHTVNITKSLDCDKAVYYSVKVRDNDYWDAAIYQKHQQHGGDLGIRMRNAFSDSFKNGYKKVLIVGSDLYDLTPQHIEDAINQLDNHDVVIGPALDGGYYLLGMKELNQSVFENKEWGTETVRKDTLENLKHKKVSLLETLNDIDIFDDIKDYEIFKPYLTKV